MVFLMSILVITLFSLFFYKSIRKYSKYYYLIAIIASILSIIFPKIYGMNYIIKGYIGLACLIIVMFIGVLNKKNIFTKRLWSIRTQLSIVGFILISPHAEHYLPVKYKWDSITGFILYIVLIPLFITSFKKFKKLLGHHWRDLHKLSYIAYLLIYIHLYFAASFDRKIIYSIIFGMYSITRFIHYKKRVKTL